MQNAREREGEREGEWESGVERERERERKIQGCADGGSASAGGAAPTVAGAQASRLDYLRTGNLELQTHARQWRQRERERDGGSPDKTKADDPVSGVAAAPTACLGVRDLDVRGLHCIERAGE